MDRRNDRIILPTLPVPMRRAGGFALLGLTLGLASLLALGNSVFGAARGFFGLFF
jgi:hypothetical protein